MPTAADQPDLWMLIRGTPSIDPAALLEAMEHECRRGPHDFRTRLLLRDVFTALQRRWGDVTLSARLSESARALLHRIVAENLGEPGFPSLERRMADSTDPRTLQQFLRELGDALQTPARMDVGGSSALILRGLLSRATDDVDVVDEIPEVLRVEHELLDGLVSRYGLRLTHFQSHYLPAGWSARVESLGRFGKLDIFLVHPLDIFVGKLFSKRTKDRDDLRMLCGSLDRSAIVERLRASAGALLADPGLRADAQRNWYILFGEDLPA
jgi:hypothetical protein